MAWSGGTFTRVGGATHWVDDKNAAINIIASRHDTNDDDLSDGINQCLTRDNQAKPTANFLPNADASLDLGALATRWRNLFLSADIKAAGRLSLGALTIPTTNTLDFAFTGASAWAAQEVAAGEADIGWNFYYNTGFKYRVTDIAAKLSFNSVGAGIVAIETASSGTADTAITWTTRFSVTSAGAQIINQGYVAATQAAISADQNNWNPTGLGTNSVIKVSASGGVVRTITGLVAQPDGAVVRFINTGASGSGNDIQFANESASSTAANRFLLPGGSGAAMGVPGSINFIYDGAASRWRYFI